MEVKGVIKLINPTKEYGEKGFKKREVVVTTVEDYPQDILVEFVQDKCAVLDAYKVGSNVSIGVNLRGREWTNPQGEVKYFNSIQGWRIEKLTSEDTDSNIPPVPPADAFEPADNINDNEPDDLPF